MKMLLLNDLPPSILLYISRLLSVKYVAMLEATCKRNGGILSSQQLWEYVFEQLWPSYNVELLRDLNLPSFPRHIGDAKDMVDTAENWIVRAFEANPPACINFLINAGRIKDASPQAQAEFLDMFSYRLRRIYHYLAIECDMAVLDAFISRFNFRDMEFTAAIRTLVYRFPLPLNHKGIMRVIKAFSIVYCRQQPSDFDNWMTARLVTFSLMTVDAATPTYVGGVNAPGVHVKQVKLPSKPITMDGWKIWISIQAKDRLIKSRKTRSVATPIQTSPVPSPVPTAAAAATTTAATTTTATATATAGQENATKSSNGVKRLTNWLLGKMS